MELSRLKQLLGIDEGDTSKDVSLSFVISDVEEIIKQSVDDNFKDTLLKNYKFSLNRYRRVVFR